MCSCITALLDLRKTRTSQANAAKEERLNSVCRHRPQRPNQKREPTDDVDRQLLSLTTLKGSIKGEDVRKRQTRSVRDFRRPSWRLSSGNEDRSYPTQFASDRFRRLLRCFRARAPNTRGATKYSLPECIRGIAVRQVRIRHHLFSGHRFADDCTLKRKGNEGGEPGWQARTEHPRTPEPALAEAPNEY